MQKKIIDTVATYILPLFLFLIVFLVFSFSVATVASADVVDHSSSCVDLEIDQFTPYIYENNTTLQAFDYIISGEVRENIEVSQITVANKDLDTRYATMWTHENGTRVHVDVPSWENYGISGEQIDVVVHVKTEEDASCETQKEFSVTLATATEEESETSSQSPTVNTTLSAHGAAVSAAINAIDVNDSSDASESDSEKEKTTTASSTVGKTNETLPQFLWIGLVLIHVAIAGGILFFLRDKIEQSNLWFMLTLLVPFVVFLGIWFVFDTSRSNQWFPIAVALISLGTVLSIPNSGGKVGSGKKKQGGSIMLMPDMDKKKGGK